MTKSSMFISSFRRCDNLHVPPRLHATGKTIIPHFNSEESLYRRVHPRHKPLVPFLEIDIKDLSVNRSGIDNSISFREDVLINSENDFGNYLEDDGWKVCEIYIPMLLLKNNCCRIISEKSRSGPGDDYIVVHLTHDPTTCNYAHSMIVFIYNGFQVIDENYDATLGSKALKNLRKACRDELHKAVVSVT
ncbi:hypothetical protein J0X19_20180 [Hymenobacter sp. BT186]|uniref:Uncharacterized protein n=1 Tax=Hymenobacter telluris TaxID=2816474 RepID=A0A939EZZ0_9BACT|nr:hypothetical protein [Hymenobacter telluris]MBO0360289.1 hypothetical protein [Hymenobacter telluris]MBW3376316.1 hypothetical protein [Hymenobacter norwichensis]